MKILSVSAQKPNSTGSGVYLTSLVNEFDKMGHKQAVIAGVYKEDTVNLPDKVIFYPVFFHTENLPFAICGMSDEMPYESTRYSDMTQKMIQEFRYAFSIVLKKAINEFNPDIIICHHLYLLTAMVREAYPDIKVYGICHNTDIRQIIKTDLEREYIKSQTRKLDAIFAASEAQSKLLVEYYALDKNSIKLLGTGYNSNLFCPIEIEKNPKIFTIIFAGKISEKKGVKSLIRSLNYLPYTGDKLILNLVGGSGNKDEYNEIKQMAKQSKYQVNFIGQLSQEELVKYYCSSDVFVLPSFNEAIPLVVIEALACGTKVVVSDLPGVRDWISEYIPKAHIDYVTLPKLSNADQADTAELDCFERRLAKAIQKSLEEKYKGLPDMQKYSWKNIAEIIIKS
ncbi:MAG: glycosyltransferase family 4 protein [Suipraeoptans sp.]